MPVIESFIAKLNDVGPSDKQRLHTTLMEIGMAFTADGVEHSGIAASATELRFTTPEEVATIAVYAMPAITSTIQWWSRYTAEKHIHTKNVIDAARSGLPQSFHPSIAMSSG